MTTPVKNLSRRHDVPVAAIMGNTSHPKARDAQCEYIDYLLDAGLTKANVGVVFGKSITWVECRITRKDFQRSLR